MNWVAHPLEFGISKGEVFDFSCIPLLDPLRFAPLRKFSFVIPYARPIMAQDMKNLTLPIVIEADEDGFFVSCPTLQGCYSQGDTYEEAVENIKDAIKLHIADRLADGEEIPQVSVSLSTVEIAV